METSPFGCFRCNDAEHWADACPELIPAATPKERQARIEKYKQWWIDGRIRIEQKRKLIEMATERKSA